MSIDKALQQCFKDSIKIKKLWTNASPNSSFGAQTIPCNTEDLDFCLVYPVSGTGYNSAVLCITAQNDTYYGVGMTNVRRAFRIGENGIVVGAGAAGSGSNYTTDNNALKPKIIYGIKLMGGGTA